MVLQVGRLKRRGAVSTTAATGGLKSRTHTDTESGGEGGRATSVVPPHRLPQQLVCVKQVRREAKMHAAWLGTLNLNLASTDHPCTEIKDPHVSPPPFLPSFLFCHKRARCKAGGSDLFFLFYFFLLTLLHVFCHGFGTKQEKCAIEITCLVTELWRGVFLQRGLLLKCLRLFRTSNG